MIYFCSGRVKQSSKLMSSYSRHSISKKRIDFSATIAYCAKTLKDEFAWKEIKPFLNGDHYI